MEEAKTLGGRIQAHRKAAGLSQEALGERLGVSRQAVSRWEADGAVPELSFEHELIMVIINEGHTDTVMDAARSAGAAGGTVLHAKGTGAKQAERFLGVSIAEEKELIIIVSKASEKAAIMKAIAENCGPGTPSGAISFSLPISAVAGLRVLEDD